MNGFPVPSASHRQSSLSFVVVDFNIYMYRYTEDLRFRWWRRSDDAHWTVSLIYSLNLHLLSGLHISSFYMSIINMMGKAELRKENHGQKLTRDEVIAFSAENRTKSTTDSSLACDLYSIIRRLLKVMIFSVFKNSRHILITWCLISLTPFFLSSCAHLPT